MAFQMTPERWTGLVFGAVATVVLGLIVVVLTSSEPSGLPITIEFADVQGLREGDPLQIAGVQIGTVQSVQLGAAGEPVSVGVKIYTPHRKRVAVNSTAIIEEAVPAEIPGQRAVEIVSAEEPGDPVRPGAVLQGQGGEFDLTIWKMKGKVERWGREIETKAEELVETAREAFEEADKRRAQRALERTPAPALTPSDVDPASAPTSAEPDGTPEEGFHPEEAGRKGYRPDSTLGDSALGEPSGEPSSASERQPWIEPETMESLAAAKEFVQELIASKEFKDLAARLLALTKRLNDQDNPPTPDEIIREWDAIQRDIQPILKELEKVDRQAAMEGLIAIIEDIEEEVGPILEYLQERQRSRGGASKPPAEETPTQEAPAEPEEELIDV